MSRFESVGINGTDYITGKPGIDPSNECITTIDYEQYKINSGDHYNVSDYSLSTASGTNIDFIITTPDSTIYSHMKCNVSSSKGALVQEYTDTSGVSGGTPITIYNNNENSINTTDLTITRDPVSIAFSGNIKNKEIVNINGSFINKDKENILLRNTIHLFRITSKDNSNDISWN